ncbi:hypothetical protein ED208_09490 [Stagnimonas aquatica]|uniref:Phosphatidylserine decarboxylase n=1 Tax=Stagnimonas aquatica TaxID=2689987 RepID=A0A3N0VES8_9GAMM|nr:hypothetical protein [Stagnimonas aquatica]ROH91175.1 hypothetical protein ED208_09490 [Stagnimonas aquatica]
MRSAYVPILRVVPEGWIGAGLLMLLALLLWSLESWQLALPPALLAPVALYWFHDNPRRSPAKPLGVLAPVDGEVIFRRECHDPYLGREAIRLGIRVAAWGNYLFRAPVEGEVLAVPGASRRVSRIQTDEGEDVLVVAAQGWLLGARPVWIPYGERVGQGRLCGLRRLSRVVDVYLPASSRVEVALGQTIRCGETVLATLLRRTER